MMKKSVRKHHPQQKGEEIEYRLESTPVHLMTGPDIEVYGIAVYRKGHKIHEVKDITADKSSLKQLVELCNQKQLSVCHLYDVIEDFLGSLYGISF